jgi:hypothetical protein
MDSNLFLGSLTLHTLTSYSVVDAAFQNVQHGPYVSRTSQPRIRLCYFPVWTSIVGIGYLFHFLFALLLEVAHDETLLGLRLLQILVLSFRIQCVEAIAHAFADRIEVHLASLLRFDHLGL